jgi:hypothetical protein
LNHLRANAEFISINVTIYPDQYKKKYLLRYIIVSYNASIQGEHMHRYEERERKRESHRKNLKDKGFCIDVLHDI